LFLFNTLHTSSHGTHVHFSTNSTDLGSIQPQWNYCAEPAVFTVLCSYYYLLQWTDAMWREQNHLSFKTAASSFEL